MIVPLLPLAVHVVVAVAQRLKGQEVDAEQVELETVVLVQVLQVGKLVQVVEVDQVEGLLEKVVGSSIGSMTLPAGVGRIGTCSSSSIASVG